MQVFSLVRTSPLAALRCWLLPLFAPQPSIPSCLWSPDERFCSHQHFIKHKLRLKSEPWNNWCEYELRIFSCFHLCSLINFCQKSVHAVWLTRHHAQPFLRFFWLKKFLCAKKTSPFVAITLRQRDKENNLIEGFPLHQAIPYCVLSHSGATISCSREVEQLILEVPSAYH